MKINLISLLFVLITIQPRFTSVLSHHQNNYRHRPHPVKKIQIMLPEVGSSSVNPKIKVEPGTTIDKVNNENTHIDESMELSEWESENVDEEEGTEDEFEHQEDHEDKHEPEVLHFPQNAEQFEIRQEFIKSLINKYTTIVQDNEHLEDVEINVQDLKEITFLLEGYMELRHYNQLLSSESPDDEEEELFEDGEGEYEGEGEGEEGDESETNEGEGESSFFDEENEEDEENENETVSHAVEDEALNVAEGKEDLAGLGEDGDENWEKIEESIEEEQQDHENLDIENHEGEEENHHHHHEEEEENHHHEEEEKIHHHHGEEEEEETEADFIEHTNNEKETDDEYIIGKNEEHVILMKEISKNDETVTFEKLPDLLVVIEGLIKSYNAIYSELPRNVNQESTHQLEKEYEKLVVFVKEVAEKKDVIQKEIDYLIEKIDTIKFNRNDILNFYSLKDYFLELENAAPHDDQIFKQKVQIIDLETEDFTNNIKEFERKINSIQNSQNYIWNETEYIRNQINSEKEESINEKVSGFSALVTKLVDMKFDIDVDLNTASNKLKTVRSQKAKFKTILDDINIYVGGDLRKLNESASIFNMMGITLVLFFISFWKFD